MIKPIEKCLECGERDRTGYKYCDECSKKAVVIKKQRQRRAKNYSKCVECNDKMTQTKYCKSCVQIVIKRKSKERYLANTNYKKRRSPVPTPKSSPVKRSIYEDIHLGEISKDQMKYFEYSKLLLDLMKSEKSEIMSHNRSNKDDRISASEKLARRKGIIKLDNMIAELLRGDEYQSAYGRMLKLEKEYLKSYEKQMLIMFIEIKTNQDYGGSYNLSEIAGMMGITRERTRQIEAAALKVLNHPLVGRKLKEMTYE